MAIVLLQVTSKNVGYIMPETWESIRNLDCGPHTVDVHILCRQRPVTPTAVRPVHLGYNMERSRLFCNKWEYDYMLIVQSDIIFPPNALLTLLKLLQEKKAGVVCALTPERPEKVKSDDFVVCMSWNGNPQARTHINRGENFKVTGNGSGYMLILVDKSVFNKYEFPRTATSDCDWYAMLQKAGVPIWCEVGMRILHKQHSDGVIIRGDKHVVERWQKVIAENNKAKRKWYHGLPHADWLPFYEQSDASTFLKRLSEHINEDRAWWSW